jgi:hypothetical protein
MSNKKEVWGEYQKHIFRKQVAQLTMMITRFFSKLQSTRLWTANYHFRRSYFQNTDLLYLLNQVLFRTRNLGQHFLDISKKNDVNQSLVSLINDNY